jgi:DnaJ like chaperone protein
VGALLGGIAGLLLTRHWLGALAGALIGFVASVAWQAGAFRARSAADSTGALFALLGRLARADGRVDETEIAFAETLMRRLGLDAAGRRVAVDAFQRGKDAQADLAGDYAQLRGGRGQAMLLLDVFIDMALADGRLDAAERKLLGRYAWMLGVRESALEALLARRQRGSRASADGAALDPYAVLGVERTASDAEVRRAFRRLMSRHHPDKRVAAGASPEMVRLAQERSQAIIAAWEAIKSARGLRG